MSDHTCHIDCKLITLEGGRRQHIMYPSDPTPHAGRYQHTQNLGMTRREYRATGQDESREVRAWNHKREEFRRTNAAAVRQGFAPMHNLRAFDRFWGEFTRAESVRDLMGD